MSKPTPTPRQNFMQTLLIITTMFLAFNLFFNKPNQQQISHTYGAELAAMLQYNADALDVTIAEHQRFLNDTIDADLKAKVITAAEADSRRIYGELLVADTQMQGGLIKDDTNRIRIAYMAVHKLQGQFDGKPVWTTSFPMGTASRPVRPNDTRSTSWTGEALHAKLKEALAARNRTDLVWGTIPGGWNFIDTLVGLTGRVPGFSYWFAAFLLALCVRGVIYPLSQRQLMWSRQMSQLTPLVKEIKEQYPNPQEQQVKVMELYKTYGLNPLAGCFPAMVQMPLFLFVYQCMLHYQFDFEKGTFLWINPAMHAARAFIAPNLGQIDYILIVLYGISMVISTMLMPISDPSQARQQRLMGVSFAVLIPVFMLFGFIPVPAAFVLYWTFTNVLATAQSLRAYRMPLPPIKKVNAPGGGVFPGDPSNGFGKSTNGKIITQTRTGTPAKHKPKKRK